MTFLQCEKTDRCSLPEGKLSKWCPTKVRAPPNFILISLTDTPLKLLKNASVSDFLRPKMLLKEAPIL